MSEIRIVAELVVKPEHREALMPVLERLVEGSRNEPGNNGYDLTEDLKDPCRFFVIERWASKEAIDVHGAAPHFQAFKAAIADTAEKLVITRLKTVF